jgi:hypothetical protein
VLVPILYFPQLLLLVAVVEVLALQEALAVVAVQAVAVEHQHAQPDQELQGKEIMEELAAVVQVAVAVANPQQVQVAEVQVAQVVMDKQILTQVLQSIMLVAVEDQVQLVQAD